MPEKNLRDLCPSTSRRMHGEVAGSRPSIHPAVVYPSRSPAEAEAQLGGSLPGYVYQRDGHPNAQDLAARCREMHGAEEAVVTSCGMSALSLALLTVLQTGDHVVLSSRMYGKTISLFTNEAKRLGITSSLVDTCDLDATAAALTPTTKMVVCETISNPILRVADLASLAELAHHRDILLLVDNTFASPVVCQPIAWGADLVMESMTKIMNGHSDVMMGLLCGTSAVWNRMHTVLTTWGLGPAPFECWLVDRGLATMYLRVVAASESAAWLAERLARHTKIASVYYPGLDSNPDKRVATKQFATSERTLYGHMMTFDLRGGRDDVTKLIANLPNIHFCASLGELATTLSHPASTSHRLMTAEARQQLGIREGTIRLSVGLESPEFLYQELVRGLEALD